MEEFIRIVNMLLNFHIEQIDKIGDEKESSIIALKRCQYTIDYLGLFHSQISNAIEIHFGDRELTDKEKNIIKNAFGMFCFTGMPKIKYSNLNS